MHRNRGFTLIEIVIVVAIIGILTAIALPSYRQQVRKGNRAAAQSFLMDVTNKEQIYLQTARQYGTLSDLGMTPPSEVSLNYSVVITPAGGTPPSFTARATPTSGNQLADGWLQIDQDGNKTSQYPAIAKW